MSEHGKWVYENRHFDDTVEMWCPNLDEAKVILGERYIRHCPMCGYELES